MTNDDIAKRNMQFLSKLFRKALGLPVEPSREFVERFKKYYEYREKLKRDPFNQKLRQKSALAFRKALGLPVEPSREFVERFREYNENWKKFRTNPFIPIYI